jgi:repressor LexA
MLRVIVNFQVERVKHMTKNKKEGLTPRQLDIFKEIKDFIKMNKFSPSYEEIKQLAGLRSKSEVHRYVHNLEARGWIKRGNGRNRSISIV